MLTSTVNPCLLVYVEGKAEALLDTVYGAYVSPVSDSRKIFSLTNTIVADTVAAHHRSYYLSVDSMQDSRLTSEADCTMPLSSTVHRVFVSRISLGGGDELSLT